MELIIIIISISILSRAVLTLFLLMKTLSWLGKSDQEPLVLSSNKVPKLYILIPVLREQQKITQTLRHFVWYFGNKNIFIYVITTQREYEKKFEGLSTFSIVNNYISENNLGDLIKVLDYPNPRGVMADQLNFALEKINDPSSYIAVYNADSMPNPNTLGEFYLMLRKYPESEVMQQSAFFIKNFNQLKNKSLFVTYLLKASAILQTRWTLTHEFPRMFYHALTKLKFMRKYGIANCVGHGLFIKTKLIKEVGGFPAETVTEDVPLGYILRSRGIDIYPMRQTELADSPVTLKGLWDQKYVWFWGPLKYITYYKQLRKRRDLLKVKDMRVPLIIGAQGLFSAFIWIISGPLLLVALLSPILTHNYNIVFLSYISILLYGPIQYWIILNRLEDLYAFSGSHFAGIDFESRILISIMSIPASIFNSIPPFFTIGTEIKSKWLKTTIYKPKTDD